MPHSYVTACLGRRLPPEAGRRAVHIHRGRGDYRRERNVLVGLLRLGGPDERACDFERRGLRDDAGAGIQLAPSVGQRFGNRVCFNGRRVRYDLFRPCGWRVAESLKRRAKRGATPEVACDSGHRLAPREAESEAQGWNRT
jgi:hypothetical protein